MSTHTPTPWGAEEPDAEGHVLVTDVQDVSVCRVYQQPYDTWRAEDTAAHIVRCVNAHDELVAALRSALSQVLIAPDECVGTPSERCEVHASRIVRVEQIARAALAKVRSD